MMRWSKGLTYLAQAGLSFYIATELIKLMPDWQTRAAATLFYHQVLNPFPSQVGEHFSFLKVIMILGLALIGWLKTINLTIDLAQGSKQLIRYHSKSEVWVRFYAFLTIGKCYVKEWLIIISVYIAIGLFMKLDIRLYESFCLFVSLFICDLLCLTITQYYAKTAIEGMCLILLGFILRSYLLLHPLVMVLLLAIFIGIRYRKENYVKN